ncbi:MAG TPA: glycosyltransferase, partial [Crenalkalicoccus sp.]|nr:glycosyltransferase [Crenalkalicoccus sp.]
GAAAGPAPSGAVTAAVPTGAELVLFAPLPPRRSGIAAYTAELLPALGALRRTVVVVPEAAEAAPAEGALAVIAEAAYRHAPALHHLPHLLMLGNGLDQAHAWRAAMRRPSLVLLHDPVLHHLVEAMTLGCGRPELYALALEREHGPAGRRLARLRELGLFAPAQRYLLPLHRAVLDRAASVVVHSRYAAGRLLGPPGLPVAVMPHHITPAVVALDGVDRAAARRRLGWPEPGEVLVALGHATPAKQLDLILRALALTPLPVRLVIGGAVPPEAGIESLVAGLGLGERVRLTGWLAEEEFLLHLRAADLLLALRFPAGGESSGTLARALGMGTPALAYDFGPAAEEPPALVATLPLTPGEAAVPALAAAIVRTLGELPARRGAALAARDALRAARRPERSARRLLAAGLA